MVENPAVFVAGAVAANFGGHQNKTEGMATTIISSRDFNQNVSRAKRAAGKGPVVITNRGRPVYVLLNHDAYRRLMRHEPTIRQLLDRPGAENIDFDPLPLRGVFRPAPLS
jgi:prevent-host-death family protein